MTDYLITYYCTCGWTGEALPMAAYQCPACKKPVFVGSITHSPVPQLVFLPGQIQRVPKGVWGMVLDRIDKGEITVHPQVLTRALARYFPARRRSPGRPPGPSAFKDREDFEARLIEIVSSMDKCRYAIRHETIACTLRLLLKNPFRSDDLSRVVKDADRDRQESKAATENLRRWCDHYGMERVKQVLSACGRQINTAFVQRLHLDIRQRVAAVGRRVNTLCQGEDGLQHPLVVFQTYHNFVLPHMSLRQPLRIPEPTNGSGSGKVWRPCTPAMRAGLTDHVWTLRAVLLFRVPPWPQSQEL
jgi:hypothetical protein